MFNVNRIVEIDEYFEFILESLHPSNQSISDHLFSNYKLHKAVNHKFCEIIEKEIQGITKAAESEFTKVKKESKLDKDFKSKKFALIGRNKVLVNIPKENVEHYQQRTTSINQLNDEYLNFSNLIERYENKGKSGVKIDWDPKSRNHLYFLLKKLKNAGLIKNSVPDLALFVKENFPAFSKSSIGYITSAINNGKEPSRGSTETVEILKELKSIK